MKIRLDDEKDGQPITPSEWYVDFGDFSVTHLPSKTTFLIMPHRNRFRLLEAWAKLEAGCKRPENVVWLGKQALVAFMVLSGQLKIKQ